MLCGDAGNSSAKCAQEAYAVLSEKHEKWKREAKPISCLYDF